MVLLNRRRGSVPLAQSRRVGFRDGLEIVDDERIALRDWWAQRAGRVLGVLLLALGMTGLMGGGGPLNEPEVKLGGGSRLQYQRVTRHGSDTTLLFTIPPGHARDGRVQVSVTASYLQGNAVGALVPEPDSVTIVGDQQVYAFAVRADGRDMQIEVQLRPKRLWQRDVGVSVGAGPTVSVTQFVLP